MEMTSCLCIFVVRLPKTTFLRTLACKNPSFLATGKGYQMSIDRQTRECEVMCVEIIWWRVWHTWWLEVCWQLLQEMNRSSGCRVEKEELTLSVPAKNCRVRGRIHRFCNHVYFNKWFFIITSDSTFPQMCSLFVAWSSDSQPVPAGSKWHARRQ